MPYHQSERITVTSEQRNEAQRAISAYITKHDATGASAYYRINASYVSKIAHCLPCPGWAVMQVLRKTPKYDLHLAGELSKLAFEKNDADPMSADQFIDWLDKS